MEETPVIRLEDAQAIVEQLGFDPMNKGVFSVAAHPEQWERRESGAYAFTSARTGEVYTVTLDTCTCPAYVRPVAAGDPPRLCYHRIGVAVLQEATARIAAGTLIPDSVPRVRHASL